MKKTKINSNGVYEGVVYAYTLKEGPDAGKCYVGCTLDEQTRIMKWKNPNTKNYGGAKLEEARKIYKPDDFDYKVLERLQGTDAKALRKLLEEREEHYIEKFDSVDNGYNTSKGGTGNKGRQWTPEQIEKMKHPVGQFHHSEETKQKLSQINKGKKHSQETVEKIKAKITGIKRTPEQRQAQSLRQKGRKFSDEARKNMSKAKLGKKHPISEQGLANINAHRFRRKVIVTDAGGNTKEFESMKAAGEAYGYAPGSVAHYIKTGNKTKENLTFKLA